MAPSTGAADPGAFGGSGSDYWGAAHFALRPAAGGLTHELIGNAITGAAPVIDSGALSQVQGLAGSPIDGGAPVVDEGAVGQAVGVVGLAIDVGAPVVDEGGLSQAHGLTGDPVDVGVPAIDGGALSQVHGLAGNPIDIDALEALVEKGQFKPEDFEQLKVREGELRAEL